jgi:aldehyde:ferredoxin oxidoreductase
MTTSNQPGGYAGKILKANLANGTFAQESLDETTLRKYVGGDWHRG